MLPPDQTQPVCSNCEERPALHEYTRHKKHTMVCAPCLDRLTLYDVSNDSYLQSLKLADEERFDEIFALADAIWEAYRHLDHEKWLERSLADRRAFFLSWAGRHHEALQVLEERAKLGFERTADRWDHAFHQVRVLQDLGKHDDAFAVFHEAFSRQDPRFISYAPSFFGVLVEVYQNLGKPVDEKWRSLAVDAAEEFAIEMPVRETLAETLLAIREITAEMPSKRQREWEKNNPNKVGA